MLLISIDLSEKNASFVLLFNSDKINIISSLFCVCMDSKICGVVTFYHLAIIIVGSPVDVLLLKIPQNNLVILNIIVSFFSCQLTCCVQAVCLSLNHHPASVPTFCGHSVLYQLPGCVRWVYRFFVNKDATLKLCWKMLFRRKKKTCSTCLKYWLVGRFV